MISKWLDYIPIKNRTLDIIKEIKKKSIKERVATLIREHGMTQ